MPVDKETLAALALGYVSAMTPIRGRRVHRLLMREFARFDQVLAATAEDGTPALLALAEGGGAAVCRTDGRGPSAAIAAWARLDNATVATSYDLLKDSLPIVDWTIRHPAFEPVAGTLTVSGVGLSTAEQSRIAGILRGLGRG